MESYWRSRPFHRLVRRTGATRRMAKLYGVVQQPLDRLVYRLTRGRTTTTSWLAGVEIAMLTTTGARTGRPRTVPVLGLPDGESTILIASNFGRPRHPSWYHNLRSNPDATITQGGRCREVRAHELRGAERERAYRRGEEIFPGFAYYPHWAQERQIPVLALEPRSRRDERTGRWPTRS
jgi:deazaflavin-dependent oxidoreductase (nitroreductase family)